MKKLLHIKTITLNIQSNFEKDIFIIVSTLLLNNIYDKLQIYKVQNSEIDETVFFDRFQRYLINIKDKSFFCDFTTPYDNLRWSPRWKLIYENTEIYKDSVDIFYRFLYQK